MPELPPEIDTSRPHQARVYDYMLGGKDNYAADRAVVERAQGRPGIPPRPENRAFLGRAVRYLTGEAGIRQFLDIGTGLPTAGNTHQIAQAVAPETRVVYADNDPMVLAHARALLTAARGATEYIDADLRDPPRSSPPGAGTTRLRSRSRSCSSPSCTSSGRRRPVRDRRQGDGRRTARQLPGRLPPRARTIFPRGQRAAEDCAAPGSSRSTRAPASSRMAFRRHGPGATRAWSGVGVAPGTGGTGEAGRVPRAGAAWPANPDAPRGASLYPRYSREELGGRFLGLMPYLDPKGEGDNSMAGN